MTGSGASGVPSRKPWDCLRCGERCEGHFVRCWNCGAGREGQVDPDFAIDLETVSHADEPLRTPAQYSLLSFLVLTVLLALVLSIGTMVGGGCGVLVAIAIGAAAITANLLRERAER